jgi:hypothetical protein
MTGYLTFENKDVEIEKIETNRIYQWLINLKFRSSSSQSNVSKHIINQGNRYIGRQYIAEFIKLQ